MVYISIEGTWGPVAVNSIEEQKVDAVVRDFYAQGIADQGEI